MQPQADVKQEVDNTKPKENLQQAIAQQHAKEPEPVNTEESDQDKNWKRFKAARDADRKRAEEEGQKRQRAEAEAAALKAALDAALNKPSMNQYSQSVTHSYESNEETDDQKIERRIAEAIAKRDIAVEQQRRQHEQETFPSRLRQDYRDFDQVCSSENLDYLDYHYPEVTAAFSSMPDGYDKWSKVYKATKRFIPNTDTKKDQTKAQQNFQKPQSMSGPGATTSKENAPAFRLDEKRKAENYARMQRTMNRVE